MEEQVEQPRIEGRRGAKIEDRNIHARRGQTPDNRIAQPRRTDPCIIGGDAFRRDRGGKGASQSLNERGSKISLRYTADIVFSKDFRIYHGCYVLTGGKGRRLFFSCRLYSSSNRTISSSPRYSPLWISMICRGTRPGFSSRCLADIGI